MRIGRGGRGRGWGGGDRASRLGGLCLCLGLCSGCGGWAQSHRGSGSGRGGGCLGLGLGGLGLRMGQGQGGSGHGGGSLPHWTTKSTPPSPPSPPSPSTGTHESKAASAVSAECVGSRRGSQTLTTLSLPTLPCHSTLHSLSLPTALTISALLPHQGEAGREAYTRGGVVAPTVTQLISSKGLLSYLPLHPYPLLLPLYLLRGRGCQSSLFLKGRR
ncbi:hypothetical protein B484DRAFT_442237 [Ochromonadaceae sp. CCMP2298]|nr:hypothetical protein B484DRAFT_442237 [Ochromonadaceae sp. CCMP2298]